MDWQSRVKEINLRFKTQPGGTRVLLYIKNNSFWGRGTLPNKPWLKDRLPYQQFICLGASAKLSEKGLKYAISQVQIINTSLDNGNFNWNDWVKTPSVRKSAFYDYLNLWFEYISFRKDKENLSPNTTVKFRSTTNVLMELPLDSSPIEVKQWILENKPLKAGRHYLSDLSRCFEWCKSVGKVEENPFINATKSLSNKEKKKEILPFTQLERDKIIQLFEDDRHLNHYAFYLKLAFFTGARPAEILALRWEDLSDKFIIFKNCLLYNGEIKKGLKTQSYRKFPINSQLLKILDSRPIKEGFLCIKKRSNKPLNLLDLSKQVWREQAYPKIIKAGIVRDYRSLYNTRHTFISLCLDKGIDAKDIAAWVGNSPETIYKHYAGANKDLLPPEL